eukprot:GILJ01009578.1.p2 GENE.GILJ01009578.1~~GILJ01009578.1.p2  ORF type:complete len:183 (-),score=32.68 GILJ01009578.1:210-758(-)
MTQHLNLKRKTPATPATSPVTKRARQTKQPAPQQDFKLFKQRVAKLSHWWWKSFCDEGENEGACPDFVQPDAIADLAKLAFYKLNCADFAQEWEGALRDLRRLLVKNEVATRSEAKRILKEVSFDNIDKYDMENDESDAEARSEDDESESEEDEESESESASASDIDDGSPLSSFQFFALIA